MKNNKYLPSKYFLSSILFIGLSFAIMQFVVVPKTYEKHMSAQVSRAGVLSGEVKNSNVLTGVLREQSFHELNPKTNTVFSKFQTFFLDTPDSRSIELKNTRINHDLVGYTVKYDLVKNSIAPAEGNEINKSGKDIVNTSANKSILNLNTLVLLAQFENSTLVPASAADYDGLLFTEKNKSYLKRFFGEMSHGKVNVTGQVRGWYTFPGNGSEYLSPYNPDHTCFINDDQILSLIDYYNEDLSNYQRVIVVTNCEEYGTIGGAYYGYYGEIFDGVAGVVRTNGNHTRLGVNGFGGYETFQDIVWNLVHEMGHGMGIMGISGVGHASSLDCGDRTIWAGCTEMGYGNPFDVMGYWSGRIFNFSHQEKAGWIDGDNIVEINESGDYFINNLQMEDGVVAAKIYTPGITNPVFAVEHRKAQGFDLNLQNSDNVTNGLLLYSLITPSQTPLSGAWKWRLVDPNPSNLEIYEDTVSDAITDSFYDEVFGIGIEIISVTSEGINFSVTYDTENSACAQELESLPPAMCPPPPPPQNFSVYPTTSATGWGATWDTAPGATRYGIQLSLNDNFTPILITHSNIVNVNGFTSNANLTPGNTYFFRIQACSDNGCSNYAPSVSLYIPL